MTEQIKKLIQRLHSSRNKRRAAVIVGIAGMMLIFISEMIPDKKPSAETAVSEREAPDDCESFRQHTETELKALLEEIDGVGECEVMVSVEGTTEYVYAENISRYTDEDDERKSDKLDENVVIVENNGEKQALVKKVIRPQVSGVVIVCDGGGNTAVNERVLKAVSTALNISSVRVCVEAKRR